MPNPHTPDIAARKDDHIQLCVAEDVGFQQKTTLLEEVELIHDALPELSVGDVDLTHPAVRPYPPRAVDHRRDDRGHRPRHPDQPGPGAGR